MLRFHIPSDEFDRGRWHEDGSYFSDGVAIDECVWKYATTFFGPGTLFAVGKGKTKKIVRMSVGQGVRWKVGGCEDATTHSEPPFSEHRLFCSLVPCTKAQCKEIWPKRPSFELKP